MAHYNFVKDKELGNIAENKTLDILHQNGYKQAYRVQGKETRWDIIIPEINKSFEVKNDLKARYTGNLAIEMFNRKGEASGIMASEADYWIIFAADEIFMLDRLALKDYCGNANHHVVMGGDDDVTQMMLVPISKIKEQPFFGRLG